MPQLTDVRFETLRALGYAGASSDMLLLWLQDGGPAVGVPTGPLKTVPDAWRSCLLQAQAEDPFAFSFDQPVLNDDFSDGLLNGWVPNNSAVLDVVNEQLEVASGDTTSTPGATKSAVTLPGEPYQVKVDYSAGTAPGARYLLGTTEGGFDIGSGSLQSGKNQFPFVATTTETWLTVGNSGSTGAVGATSYFDNIWIARAEALTEEDYHRNDWWFDFLCSKGYTGQINDRELAYWLDLFQSATGQAYSDAFGPGFG